MFKKVMGLVMGALLLSAQCFAMTFSQPVQVGKISYANMGGYIFSQVSQNDGVLGKDRGSVQRKAYDHGVARFSDGYDALYLHYDAYKANVRGKTVNVISYGYAKFGASDEKNTINVGIMMPEIFKITSDEGLTFYSINDSYDLPSEFTYTLIGRRKDGVWVKYFDTNDIAKKYFGNRQDYWLKTLSVKGNIISIYYELYNNGNYRNTTGKGEFRFKWDDKAQWFGIEQVVY